MLFIPIFLNICQVLSIILMSVTTEMDGHVRTHYLLVNPGLETLFLMNPKKSANNVSCDMCS